MFAMLHLAENLNVNTKHNYKHSSDLDTYRPNSQKVNEGYSEGLM